MFICLLEVGKTCFTPQWVNWREKTKEQWAMYIFLVFVYNDIFNVFVFPRWRVANFERWLFWVFSSSEHQILSSCRLDRWLEISSCQLEFMLVTMDCNGDRFSQWINKYDEENLWRVQLYPVVVIQQIMCKMVNEN